MGYLCAWPFKYLLSYDSLSGARRSNKTSSQHHPDSSPIPVTNHPGGNPKIFTQSFLYNGETQLKKVLPLPELLHHLLSSEISAAMIAVFRLPPHPQLNIGNVALQKPWSPTRIIASPSLAQRRPKQCVYIVFNVKFGGWRGLRVNSFAMFAFLRQAKWCNNSGSDR